jgi:uncharacterized phage protein (TIGR01671 family)
MREIKFRGKRVDNGEWVYGWLKQEYNEWYISDFYVNNVNETMLTDYEVNFESIGQFTGLKDKNGKYEFYENDIIENGGAIWIIEWNEDKCGFIARAPIIGEFTYIDFDCDIAWESKVIGNIHDNPELLEGGK